MSVYLAKTEHYPVRLKVRHSCIRLRQFVAGMKSSTSFESAVLAHRKQATQLPLLPISGASWWINLFWVSMMCFWNNNKNMILYIKHCYNFHPFDKWVHGAWFNLRIACLCTAREQSVERYIYIEREREDSFLRSIYRWQEVVLLDNWWIPGHDTSGNLIERSISIDFIANFEPNPSWLFPFTLSDFDDDLDQVASNPTVVWRSVAPGSCGTTTDS